MGRESLWTAVQNIYAKAPDELTMGMLFLVCGALIWWLMGQKR